MKLDSNDTPEEAFNKITIIQFIEKIQGSRLVGVLGDERIHLILLSLIYSKPNANAITIMSMFNVTYESEYEKTKS